MLAGLWINAQSNKSGCNVHLIERLFTIRHLILSFINQGIQVVPRLLLGMMSRPSGELSSEPSVAGHRSVVASAPHQSPEEHGGNQKPKNHSKWPLNDLKEILDAIQRLACIGLGIWAFVRTNNYIEFAAIIAIGQVNTRSAKDVVERVFKAIINEYIKL